LPINSVLTVIIETSAKP